MFASIVFSFRRITEKEKKFTRERIFTESNPDTLLRLQKILHVIVIVKSLTLCIKKLLFTILTFTQLPIYLIGNSDQKLC